MTMSVNHWMDCHEVLYRHQGPQRMNPTYFVDLDFFPALPAGQTFHLSCEISQHLLDGLAKNFGFWTFMVPRV